MAENPTKGGVHHSAFLSRKTAPAAPLFHVRGAKVVKNRAENQSVNISSHSAKNRSPTLKSPRIPHVTGDCVRRHSNNLLGQFRKITTDFRRTFSHKIPLASQNHLFQQSLDPCKPASDYIHELSRCFHDGKLLCVRSRRKARGSRKAEWDDRFGSKNFSIFAVGRSYFLTKTNINN